MSDHRKYCLNCFSIIPGVSENCSHCQYPQPAQYDPSYIKPQYRLYKQYYVGRVLGHGGFGVTYLAYDRNLSTKVAIKEYFPRDFSRRSEDGVSVVPTSNETAELFKMGKDKFIAEARLLASLRSNHIIQVRHFFEEANTAYFVMEYLEGRTLEEYIQLKGGQVSVHEAKALLKDLLTALEDLHEKNCYHRDIKPENIYLTRKGMPILLDFGAARKQVFGNVQNSSEVFLTPGFTPLEQYSSNGIQGPWTDIYALAATLYKAITGLTPPTPQDRLEGHPLKTPKELGVDISPDDEKWLLKGLEIKWSGRPESVEEWRTLIEGTPEDEEMKQRKAQEETFVKIAILPKLGEGILTPAGEQEVLQAAGYMNIKEDRALFLINKVLEKTGAKRGDPIADKFVEGWLKNLYD